jgi:hypothetical protein
MLSTSQRALGLAEENALRRAGDRLQPRRARLVDGLSRHRMRNAGTMCDLPAGVRSRACLAAVANPGVIEIRGGEPRLLQGCASGHSAEFGWMEILEGAAVLADRRASSSHDHHGARHTLSLSNERSRQRPAGPNDQMRTLSPNLSN